jgi:hypothetical protein
MICWLPEERWTAKQLLEHPFLTKPESEYQLSRAQSFQDVSASLNLVEQFATTKPRSKTITPLNSTTPNNITPNRTPNRTPEPSFKSLSVRGRTPTDLSDYSQGSASLVPTSHPRVSNVSDSGTSNHPNKNKSSQDLIDSILGNKSRKSAQISEGDALAVTASLEKFGKSTDREDGDATPRQNPEPTARDLRCAGDQASSAP